MLAFDIAHYDPKRPQKYKTPLPVKSNMADSAQIQGCSPKIEVETPKRDVGGLALVRKDNFSSAIQTCLARYYCRTEETLDCFTLGLVCASVECKTSRHSCCNLYVEVDAARLPCDVTYLTMSKCCQVKEDTIRRLITRLQISAITFENTFLSNRLLTV